MPPARVVLPMLVLLAVTNSVAPTATGAEASTVSLTLAHNLEMANATLLLGDLSFAEPLLRTPGFVGARTLALPSGTLWACPAQPGTQDEIPPTPVLEEQCRGEESYEEPAVAFGSRTWFRVGGNHTMVTAPNATMSMLVPFEGGRGLLWAGLGSPDGMTLSLDQGTLAFRPTLSSSEVRIEAGGQASWYNGTDWIFYFEGSDTFNLGSQGFHAGLDNPQALELRPAGLEALSTTLEPRRLLDVQAAVLGHDAREPMANATALFADRSRVAQFLNGALLGHLNGTLGDQQLDPAEVHHVRAQGLTGQLEGDQLALSGPVVFHRGPQGFSAGDGDPASLPWWLMGVLWIAAAALVLLRGPGERVGNLSRGIAVGTGLLALLVWDQRFEHLTSASASSTLFAGGELGVILALVGFEVLAFVIGALLFVLPLRIALSRGLPRRLSRWSSPAAQGAYLVLILLVPGVLLAAGSLLARL